MLKTFHLCKPHQWRVRRYKRLTFHAGLNLIIGPNGPGKSTILRAIAGCPDCRRQEEGPTDYVLFDSENMNPRHAQKKVRTSTDMVLELRALFSSHGEILQAAFSALRMNPNSCLLFDEPESGQDFDHILSLRAAIDRAVAQGVQVIIATHEVIFWERAHIIELRRGYRRRITNTLCRMKCLNPKDPTP